MADTLSTLSVIAFVLAGVFFALAIILFIVLKIPQVLDYFTNRSAKKSVQKMVTNQSGTPKNASFHTSPTNRARGKLTEPVNAPPAPNLPPQPRQQQKPTYNPQETGVLSGENGTSALNVVEELTEDLAQGTQILDQNGTEVLAQTVQNVAAQRPHVELTMLDEIMMIHTDEVI